MKKVLFLILSFFHFFTLSLLAQQAVGADVSWCTEMEADGKKFYDASGKETELMQLLHGMGMNAVRLRIWVNPASGTVSQKCYGSAWCDKADVVAKAVRAKNAGMDVMIDFHYSDFFADPGNQNVPNDWSNYTFDQVKEAVAAHTTDVLAALKDAGVTPKWVQIGNETRNGMLWPHGQLWDVSGHSGAKGWASYTKLYMAGYNAAKAVFADALVMPHLNHAYEDNAWWFDDLKKNGGKFDMIALSHYPQTDDTSQTAVSLNTKAASQIQTLAKKYGVKVIISEVGVKVNDNESTAKTVINDFYSKVKDVEGYAGFFYWEPQLYGWWKPSCYTTLGWNAYNMGAFSSNGRPSSLLTELAGSAGVEEIAYSAPAQTSTYNIYGQKVDGSHKGIVIRNGKKYVVSEQ